MFFMLILNRSRRIYNQLTSGKSLTKIVIAVTYQFQCEYMAKLGVRTVDELVGRTDLLKAGKKAAERKIDLSEFQC